MRNRHQGQLVRISSCSITSITTTPSAPLVTPGSLAPAGLAEKVKAGFTKTISQRGLGTRNIRGSKDADKPESGTTKGGFGLGTFSLGGGGGARRTDPNTVSVTVNNNQAAFQPGLGACGASLRSNMVSASSKAQQYNIWAAARSTTLQFSLACIPEGFHDTSAVKQHLHGYSAASRPAMPGQWRDVTMLWQSPQTKLA